MTAPKDLIQLFVLGSQDLTGSGGASKDRVLRHPKRMGLLTYLTLFNHGGFAHRDQLLAAFWPEAGTGKGRNALNQMLHHLRVCLGEDTIETRGRSELRVNPDRLWCDALAFNTAVNACDVERVVELYGGDLLDGLHVPAAPEFEHWLQLTRAKYRTSFCLAAMDLADQVASKGRDEAAKLLASKALEVAPYDEVLHRRRLTLLDRLGARGEVVLVHQEFVRRLAQELDVEPSSATQQLVEQLKSPTITARTPVGDQLAASDVAPVVRGDAFTDSASAKKEVRRERRKSKRLVPIAVAVAGAVSLLMSYMEMRPRTDGPTVVANRVLVLPFEVGDPSQSSYLRHGAMELLSYALDGAGQVRRVDPFSLVRFLESGDYATIGPNEGRQIAQHFGAGRYVLGRAMEFDDQIRLSASVYDTESQNLLFNGATESATQQLSQIIDDLAAQVITHLAAGDGGRLQDLRTVQAQNYQAVKAYVIGENYWRRGWPDSALPHLREAVAFDSTFALAWYRIAVVEGFSQWSGGLRPTEMAMRYRDELPRRDQLLVEAWYSIWHGDGRRGERAASEVARHFPTHLESWEALATVRHFYSWQYGLPITDTWEPITMALNLEPAHPLVSWRALFVSMQRRDYVGAAAHFSDIVQGGAASSWLSILPEILAYQQGDPDALRRLFDILGDASPFEVFNAAFLTAGSTDSLAVAQNIYTRLTDPDRSSSVRAFGFLQLAHLAVARGRWSAAGLALDSAEMLVPDLALFYRSWLAAAPFLDVPQSELAAIRDSVLRWRSDDGVERPISDLWSPQDCGRSYGGGIETPGLLWFLRLPDAMPKSVARHYLLGLLHARIGNRMEAEKIASDLQRTTCPPDDMGLRSDLASEIRGLAAWQGGRFDEAERLLDNVSLRVSEWADLFSPLSHRPFARYVLAESLAELGRRNESFGWHGSWQVSWGTEFIWSSPATFRVGQLLEGTDPDSAASAYRSFMARWRNADPHLQIRVTEARERLSRLVGPAVGDQAITTR